MKNGPCDLTPNKWELREAAEIRTGQEVQLQNEQTPLWEDAD